MKIAVVEDESLQREQLLRLLSKWIEDRQRKMAGGVRFTCRGFPDGESFLAAAASERFDLVFLDIFMHAINGIDTAAQLYQQNKQCEVIFLTSSREHMLDAFSVHAFDYLIKPVDEQRLWSVLEDVTAVLPEWQRDLQLPLGQSTVSVPYSSIRCITADAQYCLVYSDDVCRCRIAFGKLTQPLTEDARFLVINRGILVNMDYVVSMERYICLMNGGLQLPLNTRNSGKLRQALTNYRFACRARRMHNGGVR